MAEITHVLNTDKRKSSWSAWLRGPANRHRFVIVGSLGFIVSLLMLPGV